MRELEEAILQASVPLNSIDIANDLLLTDAQKFSLEHCNRLRRRVKALYAAVDEIEKVGEPDHATGHHAAIAVADESAARKRCYMPATLFKTPNGHFVRADALGIGDMVVGRDRNVEIVSAILHPPQQEQLVELSTATTKLKVTGSHRIVVPCIHGEDEIFATHVQVSSLIICEKMP